MSETEIRNILQKNGVENNIIEDLIMTNNIIADEINTSIDINQALFPNYETPEDIKILYHQNKNNLIIQNQEDI
jgi:hypothetical protein